MCKIAAAAAFLVFSASGLAQLTLEQREADFRYLASLYSQKYAPYEWKRDALQYDALDLKPWLERVRESKDDLNFYETCVRYVASLNDAHDSYSLPSTFVASLGFSVDLFDGKVLIDSITRSVLPAATYPFESGDELVMLDGKTPEELIAVFEKYAVLANPLSTRRLAASWITVRRQRSMPRAHDVADSATVMVRRVTGDLETYTIPWQKTGVPVASLAPGRSPRAAARSTLSAGTEDESPSYLWPLRRLRDFSLPDRPSVTGVGRLKPVFVLPEGFVQRQGKGTFDSYYSGTFEADGLKIGFIRIPDFSFFRFISDFAKEIAFLEENTDALVVDVMRNPGGNACLAESLLAYLMPAKFQLMTAEVRVSWTDLLGISSALEEARRDPEAGPEDIAELEWLQTELEAAYRQNRGKTRPVPLCGTVPEHEPAMDETGKVIAFTKPIVVLIDEFSASSAEIFAATFQDNSRGPLLGMRTVGAGGSPSSYPAGIYSEGTTYVTESLVIRNSAITTAEYPPAPYIENIGVRPDIVLDYMKKENLMDGGRPFVSEFTSKMVEHIRASKQP